MTDSPEAAELTIAEPATLEPNHLIRRLRQDSRQLVRAFGLLDDYCLDINLTPAQAHALIELEAAPINGVTLAERLCLNKSNASRVLKQLLNDGLITLAPEPKDHRSQLASLTDAGRAKLAALNTIYDNFTSAALAQLTPQESSTILNALNHYRRAIDRAMAQRTFQIRLIEPRDDVDLADVIRRVSEEHGLGGAGYGVSDLNAMSLSAHYQQQDHIYWVITQSLACGTDQVVGGVGVQPLAGDTALAELSKMYFLPTARGYGLARRLTCQAIRFAQERGYEGLYLETTEVLQAALKLYQSLGFQRLTAHRGSTGHQRGCEIAMLYAF